MEVIKKMRAGMAEASKLVRSGALVEAVAAIQRTLGGLASGWRARRRSYLQEPHRPLKWPRYSLPASRPGFPPAPEVAPAGQFLAGSYTNHAGTRAYKLYVPAAYPGQALPLVVMLHGCTQNPDDFAAGTRMNVLAEEHQCFIVYPAQTKSANGSNCWNWFKATDQHRDLGEPSIIAGITRQIIATYPVDTRRVYVAGLSAGAAMAATMGIRYPDLYAAVGVHSGLPHGVAHDVPSALAAMQRGDAAPTRQQNAGVPGASAIPLIVFHGDRDTTVNPRNGDQVIAQWAAIHAGSIGAGTAPSVTTQHGQVPGGRAFTRAVHYDATRQAITEQWQIHDVGHAWSGGSASGSYTDPLGPDASREMIRFFYAHPRGEAVKRS